MGENENKSKALECTRTVGDMGINVLKVESLKEIEYFKYLGLHFVIDGERVRQSGV